MQMLYQLRQREKGTLNMKCNDGIHTFSLKTRSSYSEIQNIRVQNACIRGKRDHFSLNQNFCIADYKDKGVEILLHQSLVHPSWVTLIVNPSSLLADEYQPTELFRPTEQTMKQLKTRLRTILDEIGLDTRLKAFRLARYDQTRDRYYSSADEVASWLGIFKKSWPMLRYTPVSFSKDSEFDEKWKGANQHAWTIPNKSCAFSVYDKAYELKKRHGIKIQAHILRLELRLSRKRIVQLCRETAWDKQLLELYEKQDAQLDKFLHRLHLPESMQLVTREKALETIDASRFREKTQKKLRRIAKKADGCETLAAVQKATRIKKKEFMKMLGKFEELGICPIPNTLAAVSVCADEGHI